MNKVIKANERIISPKTRFMFGFSDAISESREREDETLKEMIAAIADGHEGFSITVFIDGRKKRYIGFIYNENWRVAYFWNGVPYGHFEGDRRIEEFLSEITNYSNHGYDLYVKAV